MGQQLLAAGRLDRRVTIVRDGPATKDSMGEAIASAPIEVERWASVRPAPGTERFANAENAASAPMRFVFRWEDDLVRATDRLRHDGRTFDVKSVIEIGRREGLEILAVGRTDNG